MAGRVPFPAHLSPHEREAVLEKAVNDLYREALAETAAELGITETELDRKWGENRKATHLAEVRTTISLSWQAERIAALEAEMKLGHQRLKALEAKE